MPLPPQKRKASATSRQPPPTVRRGNRSYGVKVVFTKRFRRCGYHACPTKAGYRTVSVLSHAFGCQQYAENVCRGVALAPQVQRLGRDRKYSLDCWSIRRSCCNAAWGLPSSSFYAKTIRSTVQRTWRPTGRPANHIEANLF